MGENKDKELEEDVGENKDKDDDEVDEELEAVADDDDKGVVEDANLLFLSLRTLSSLAFLFFLSNSDSTIAEDNLGHKWIKDWSIRLASSSSEHIWSAMCPRTIPKREAWSCFPLSDNDR